MTGDLLLTYPSTALLARISLVFVVMLSHPVISFPVCPCILNTVGVLRALQRQARTGIKAHRTKEMRRPAATADTTFVTDHSQRVTIGVYLLLTTIAALVVTDLGIVISLAGAVSATIIVFIAPGACYWALAGPSGKRLLAGILGVSGCVLLPMLVFLVLAANGYIAWWRMDAEE